MKKCPRCGYEVKDDEKYCPHCGLDLQGRYRPIKQKNKSMTYLLYVIIFFSFILIPLAYSRLLTGLSSDINTLTEKRVELEDIKDVSARSILGTYDTLADFRQQFTNVDSMVTSIEDYETTLQAKGYTFDKTYQIVVFDNNNVAFALTYTTKINDQLQLTVERRYDRNHTYDREKVILKKTGVNDFKDLLLNEEENAIVKTFTGEQKVTDQLMNDFSARQDEFEQKKEKLGHYGIGNYDGRSSFVAYRSQTTYYSELTYVRDMNK